MSEMSADETDEGRKTPGPFILEAMGCIYRGDKFVLHLSADLDDAECDDLVSLLNKGTHFEHMMAALKLADERLTRGVVPSGGSTHEAVWTAIAKAKGE